MSTTASTSSPLAQALHEAPLARLSFPGLLRSEVRRIRLRRMTWILLLGYLVGMVLLWGFSMTRHSAQIDSSTLQTQYEQAMADCIRTGNPWSDHNADGEGGLAPMPSMVTNPSNPDMGGVPSTPNPGENPTLCREVLGDSALKWGTQHYYQTFFLVDDFPEVFIGVSLTFGLFVFILGSSFVGADWAAKTLPGLLTWESRRLRVLSAKLLALLGVVTLASALVHLVMVGYATLLAQWLGSTAGMNNDFWRGMTLQGLRGVALSALFTTMGYSLTLLLRHTAAAMGLLAAYLVAVELIVQNISQRSQQYLATSNSLGWLTKGGIDITIWPEYARSNFPGEGPTPEIIHLSNGRCGLYLLAWVVAVLIVSAAAFRRRDIA